MLYVKQAKHFLQVTVSAIYAKVTEACAKRSPTLAPID